MVWVEIIEKKDSNYNNKDYLVFFDYFGKKRYSIVTKIVLKYLNVNELNVGDKIFVMKSFNKKGVPCYFIKKIKK